MVRAKLIRIAYVGFSLLALVACIVIAILALDGQRKPDTSGEYVALGSSFAAGIGLGPREPDSPLVCLRSSQGYPKFLTEMVQLSLVDMTCSGSTTEHILHGGQVFLGPQLDAVGTNTLLVTITTGGNDVNFIGDLIKASGRGGILSKIVLKDPKPIKERDFTRVSKNLIQIIETIRRRAPKAIVVLVGYPALLPENASCAAIGIDQETVSKGREVARLLNEATRLAAKRSGAIFLDMTTAGKGHDVCSAVPWVNGASPESGAPFHPNHDGAIAIAGEVFKVITGKISAKR